MKTFALLPGAGNSHKQVLPGLPARSGLIGPPMEINEPATILRLLPKPRLGICEFQYCRLGELEVSRAWEGRFFLVLALCALAGLVLAFSV